MTLAVENPRDLYNGDGATDTFPISFEFFGDAANVKVILRDESSSPATEAVQANGVDYNVVGSDVVMVTPPTADEKLLVIRNMDIEQVKDYQTFGAFLQEDHEQGLDFIVAMLQQLREMLARSPKLYNSSADSEIFMDDYDAGKVLQWHATEKRLTNVDLIVGSTGPQGDPGPLPTFAQEVPAGAVDGVNDTFTISNAPAANSLKVYVNGLRQRPTLDYSLAGTTITMVTPPPIGAFLDCDYAY